MRLIVVNKTEKERLAVIEEQLKQNISEHRNMKDILTKMDVKLDSVIREKADKRELNSKVDKEHFIEVRNKINSLNKYLIGAGVFIISLLLSVVGYFLTNSGI